MKCWAILTGLLAVSAPVQAQVPDCMAEGYLALFEVEGVDELTCAEVFRFTIPTPGGEKIVRGIADLNADWAFQPGTVAAAEAAAREATAALPALGTYRIGDVTILLLSDQLRPEETRRHHDRDVLAQAWHPVDRVADECLMTQFLWGEGGVTEAFPTTLAHELFHCVQYATFSPDQMATYTKGGDWWIEGSAEAFAAFAIADSRGTADHGPDFNAAVSDRIPLYKLSYEATIFFYWLIQTREISGLLPFLAGMSNEIGADAQRAAMRGAMTDDEWLDFAEAYADESILHPHDQPLGLQGRFPIEYRFIEATGSQRMTFEPFAVIPGVAEYECGRWENRLSEANLSSRLQSEFDWQDGWRPETDTRDGAERELRFVAMDTGYAPREVTLRAQRLAACTPCQGSTEIDRCIVGNWEGDTRPLMEMLRRAGAPLTRNAMGSIYLQVNEDGTFVTSDVPIDFQTTTVDDDGPTTVDVAGTAGRSAGRWSILGPGRLAGCADVTDATVAEGAVEGPGYSGTVPLFGPPGGGEEGSVSYSCGPAAMSTRVQMGRFGEVEFPFTRLSPPPEE